ncbi:MAG: hypothetical protein HY718_02950 [Planctomycetes bacterium]|nr:hypothetical protein [Planctomycetota bacterium]
MTPNRPRTCTALVAATSPLLAAGVCGAGSAGAGRDDIPAWWRQTRSIYCPFDNSGAGASLMQFQAGGGMTDQLTSFRELPRLLDDARRLGSDVIYLVGYWQGGYEAKGDYIPYEALGGEAAFREGIEAVHRRSGRLIVYLEGFIISRKTDFARRVGPAWAMMDEHGQFYPYFHTGERFYLMYPGEGSGWTDHIVGVAADMARKYRVDGVHLDSYGLQWDWRDHHPAHPRGQDPHAFNQGAINLVRRMRTEMRKHNPEAIVILEGAEHVELLDACDGAQIESLAVLKTKPWWRERKYPIYTSGFELAEMKAILDEGYHLALSAWWLDARPGGKDEERLRATTDKRNRVDQLRALARYNNLLLANGIEALPAGFSKEISDSIVKQLDRLKWQGQFVNPQLRAAADKVLALYHQHRDRLTRTPADQLRDWLRQAPPPP